MYRCSVFCLHLRLPCLMRPAEAGPHPCGHLPGALPIRTLPCAPPYPLRMASLTAAACLQSCPPPAAPPHEQTSPDAHSTTACHNPLTDCGITPRPAGLLSVTAPGMSAICRRLLSLIPPRILGSLLLLFPASLATSPVLPLRAGRPEAAGAQSGLNPHCELALLLLACLSHFYYAMGHHGPHTSQAASKLLHLLKKIMSCVAGTVPDACATAPALAVRHESGHQPYFRKNLRQAEHILRKGPPGAHS